MSNVIVCVISDMFVSMLDNCNIDGHRYANYRSFKLYVFVSIGKIGSIGVLVYCSIGEMVIGKYKSLNNSS